MIRVEDWDAMVPVPIVTFKANARHYQALWAMSSVDPECADVPPGRSDLRCRRPLGHPEDHVDGRIGWTYPEGRR